MHINIQTLLLIAIIMSFQLPTSNSNKCPMNPINIGLTKSTSKINSIKSLHGTITLCPLRGGMIETPNTSDNIKVDNNVNVSFKKVVIRNALGIWGSFQVLAILGNAIKRLFPIALQPFVQKDILPYQWAMYAAWCLYMSYAEGFKAFHQKFSPLVVERAFKLIDNPSFINYILAGPYSMGLFGAPKKRMMISWAITMGVFALVHIVKKLPYPYRSIIDAGVVVGLSIGSISIIWNAALALFGKKSTKIEEKTD